MLCIRNSPKLFGPFLSNLLYPFSNLQITYTYNSSIYIYHSRTNSYNWQSLFKINQLHLHPRLLKCISVNPIQSSTRFSYTFQPFNFGSDCFKIFFSFLGWAVISTNVYKDWFFFIFLVTHFNVLADYAIFRSGVLSFLEFCFRSVV